MRPVLVASLFAVVFGLCAAEETPKAVVKKWADADSATLKFAVTQNDSGAIDPGKFPDRKTELAECHKRLLADFGEISKAIGSGDFVKGVHLGSRLIISAKGSVDQGAEKIEYSLSLFRDKEATWPKDSDLTEMEVWGVRCKEKSPLVPDPDVIILYHLVLSGTRRPDGTIRGTLMGKTSNGGAIITFRNVAFVLAPE